MKDEMVSGAFPSIGSLRSRALEAGGVMASLIPTKLRTKWVSVTYNYDVFKGMDIVGI